MRSILLLILFVLKFSILQVSAQGNTPLPQVNKQFSVVVHLVLDQAGEKNVDSLDIESAFDVLNDKFSKIGMSFTICEYRIVPNYQYDVLKFDNESNELTIKHNIDHRINMYFIEAEEEKPATCGKATLNGINQPGSVWILKKCIKPGDNTLSHEIGHFFGLEHTFNNPASQLVNGVNCETTGDQICDTPADPYVDGEPIADYMVDCKFISDKKDANGDFYDPYISNIMSYYTGCTCDFTDGQYRKMVENYLQSIPNNW